MNKYKLSPAISWHRSTFLLVIVVICISVFGQAQVNTRSQLLDLGRKAYKARNFVDAAVYFYAYIQRSPNLKSTNPEHFAQVQTAYNFSVQQAQRAVTERDYLLRVGVGSNSVIGKVASLPPESLGPTSSESKVSPPALGRELPPSSKKTYPLVCRGGGDMHFTFTPSSNLSSQPQIWIRFVRASQGVGARWQNLDVLQPGQCSSLDRAVGADEPEIIALLNVNLFSIQWQRGQVPGVSSSLHYLNVLQNAGKYQAFDVYNSGKGYFVVTKIDQSR